MTNEACERVLMAAAALDDGESAELTLAEIDAHAEQCPACRAALASLTALQSRFAGVERLTDELEVWPAVREKLTVGSSRGLARRRNSILIVAVAVAVVVLLAVAAPQFWKGTPKGPGTNDAGPTVSHAPPDGPSANAPHADENSSSSPAATTPPSASRAGGALAASLAPHLLEQAEGEGGAPAPYSDEAMADELAIGVVENVIERGNVKYLPIALNEVFLGRLPTGRFLAEDKMVVRMECSLPPVNLGTRSQLYKPGTSVVVYLRHRKAANEEVKGWQVASLVPITPGSETYWHDRLQTFADVVLAGESEDSEARFRELLVLQRNGSLEDTLYHAMMIHPHPAARPVVRDLWRQRVKQHPVDPEESDAEGAMALVYLLRNLNEGGMLDEILVHGLRQKPGRRGYYISQLRILAEHADAASRGRLQAGLRKFLADEPALETLDPVKDALLWGDVANARQAVEYLEALGSRPQNK